MSSKVQFHHRNPFLPWRSGGGGLASQWSFRVWVCLAMAVASLSLSGAPAVWLDHIPTYGSTELLTGKISGVDPATYGVAVLIYVPGYGWVSKPSCGALLAPVAADGTWQADITTGGADTTATRVAALLIPRQAPISCFQGTPVLTPALSNAVASTVSTRQHPAYRWLRFSGYDWWVKRSTGRVGPGPNYFSDSTNNVWVDGQGRLHLRITSVSNRWYCAEIVSARSFGRGSYRFEVASDVDRLDRNAVLGLFTWSDDPAFAHREIDFEAARWGNAADLRNAQYVVQPFDSPGHLLRLTIPRGVTNATHSFDWQSNKVVFSSQRGPFNPQPATSNRLAGWTYTLGLPEPGDENVRLNLWLTGGTPPSNGQEQEIILSSFVFMPAGIPPAPEFLDHRVNDGALLLTVATVPDRRYVLQTSPDLSTWEDERTLVALSDVTELEVPVASMNRFFRVLAMP